MKLTIALTALLLLANAGTAQIQNTVSLRGKSQQLKLYGPPEGVPVVLSSGDLGWAGLVVHVAEFLSSKGYYIIGFNTKSYLASFTSGSSRRLGGSPR